MKPGPTAEKCNPFNALCDHLDESEECQYTFSELEELFAQFSDEDTVYTRKLLLRKLSARYGSDLVINVKNGPCSDSTACFRDKAAHTLQENWTQKGLNHSDKDIIDMAVILVRNAIRLTPYSQEDFLDVSSSEESLIWSPIPDLLLRLIEGIMPARSSAGDTNVGKRRRI